MAPPFKTTSIDLIHGQGYLDRRNSYLITDLDIVKKAVLGVHVKMKGLAKEGKHEKIFR